MLAIAGGKGGCGKTTTALGVASVLARSGRKPLVIDADCDMPDLHHLASIDRRSGVDALAAGRPLARVLQRSPAFPGVGLVTAGSRRNLDAALRAASRWHGPVLVDCPPGVGPGAVRPLRHASVTLLVSIDEPACLDDVERTGSVVRRLGSSPLGLVFRETRTDTSADNGIDDGGSGEFRVLARIPSVDSPFDHPQVLAGWERVSEAILGHNL